MASPSPFRRCGSLAAVVFGICLPGVVPAAAAAPLPYPQALTAADAAAHAVLARAGREACLRGKLTGALLGLSFSCEASGRRSPLCALADRAVVVTPMTLAFMDQTAQQLLELIGGSASVPGAAGSAAAGAARP